jgi:hypothetical protein
MMDNLALALEDKYGAVADTAGDEIVAWRHPNLPQPNAAELKEMCISFNKKQKTIRDRVDAYLPLGEQLDMIYKDKLNNTNYWFEHIKGVKDAYPKD